MDDHTVLSIEIEPQNNDDASKLSSSKGSSIIFVTPNKK